MSCFIIAELSGNHHQKYEEAEALIRAAAKAGADAIKSQTYTADTITLKSDKKWFRVGGKNQPGAWQGRTLYDLYTEAHTPWAWLPKLKKLTESLGLVFFTSVFDESAVDFNEKMGVKLYKIAAYETSHFPLLKKVAATGKPIIMSVGFDSKKEVAEAVKILRAGGARDITLLHCVTTYGAQPKLTASHLATIRDIEKSFGVKGGFSDNTGGITVPVVAATVAGAKVIEKHLTLDRKAGGPDAQFSIEPAEFAEMVRLIRAGAAPAAPAEIKQMLGRPHYGPSNTAEKEKLSFRPSIWVKKDIRAGEKFTPDNIRVARPNAGLAPKYWDKVLGKKAKRKIEAATPLTRDLIAVK